MTAAVLLKLSRACTSPDDSDAVGLGSELKFCISNKLPSDVNDTDPRNTDASTMDFYYAGFPNT